MNARVREIKAAVERSMRACGGDAHEVAEALALSEGLTVSRIAALPSGRKKMAITFDPRRTEQDEQGQAVSTPKRRRKRRRSGAAGAGAEDENRHGMLWV